MGDLELYKKYINFAFYYCDLVLYGKGKYLIIFNKI